MPPPGQRRESAGRALARGDTGSCDPAAMGRRINKLTMGPAGICNLCGRRCGTLDQAGMPCFHCQAPGAIFIHRIFWHFAPCPGCDGVFTSLCDQCNRVGCLAIAKEFELDVRELYRWMVSLPTRYASERQIPAAVAENVAFARAALAELEAQGEVVA